MTSLFDDDEVSRLRVALGRISRQVDRQTSAGELTKTQFSILTTAVRRGPIRASEMAEIETLNPTMLSRMIGKMEAAGLLMRSAHPDDGRAVVVAATGNRHRQGHEYSVTVSVRVPDAEITARIANYEMAFKLQTSVPEVADFLEVDYEAL
mgnify:CR=1 FL=1